MKKIAIFIFALTLFATQYALGDGGSTVAGDPNHPAFMNAHKSIECHYKSELIEKLFNLYADLPEYDRAGVLLQRRKEIIDYINAHPEEVNDYSTQDFWSASPLSIAYQYADTEFIKLLLAKGAIPFPPPGDSQWANGDLAKRKGNKEERATNMIFEAQKKYSIFRKIMEEKAPK